MQTLWLGALCALIAWPTLSYAAPRAPTRQEAQSKPLIAPSVPEGMFKIEGSERPEQIPDHWVWRAAFLKLGALKQMGDEGSLESVLPLSSADAKPLYREALLQSRRDAACLHEIQTRRGELLAREAGQAVIDQALNEITLDCRTKDLDAADRVLDALSEEGRRALLAWVDAKRRSMTAFVPIQDKEIFRLPR